MPRELPASSAKNQSPEFNWACNDCEPVQWFSTAGKVQSHKRREHLPSTTIKVGSDKVYRVWRKDGVFTCPLCQGESVYQKYLRDHLNPERKGENRCNIDKQWASLAFLPDTWELLSPNAAASSSRARPAPSSPVKEEPTSKRPKPTPKPTPSRARKSIASQPRPLAASSSSAVPPASSSPARRSARNTLAAHDSSSSSSDSSTGVPSSAFTFKLPPSSAALSATELSEAQAHVDALNKLFGRAAASPKASGDGAQADHEPAPAPAPTSWFNPRAWF